MSNAAVDILNEEVDLVGLSDLLKGQGEFWSRHIGPGQGELAEMLSLFGCTTLEQFADKVLPDSIKLKSEFMVSPFAEALSEPDTVKRIKKIAEKNIVCRALIGCGYHATHTPTVIQRNILENPGWYTQYTPYQPEISQGRLEALLNFQTVACELTGFPVSNASLLDEATAAAEAMSLSFALFDRKAAPEASKFFVAASCHPQNIDVVQTRAEALGLEVVVGEVDSVDLSTGFFGALLQYPDTFGEVRDYSDFISSAKAHGILVTLACDPMALLKLKSPAELGADIAVGSMQRFGIPLGYGGPHPAFFATKDEYKRMVPGRIVGVSKDRSGRPALRLALQTREQHIRRERATSNICTAQVLLAIMAGMYAVYHGPKGLRTIAERIHDLTAQLKASLKKLGIKVKSNHFFDTLCIEVPKSDEIIKRAESEQILFRKISDTEIGITLDETCDQQVLLDILSCFTKGAQLESTYSEGLNSTLLRSDPILEQAVFQEYHSETEFLRYLKRLEAKDLSLAFSMIPLGSCTMKLNATTEMVPVSWPEFGQIHPFAPEKFVEGYKQLFSELEEALAQITGFDGVSLQPNAGSQGEYAGLLCIRRYHLERGDTKRVVCLIPRSAHGTNPASAIMAGLKVVPVECDKDGNIDLGDLKAKLDKFTDTVAAIMVTYPSTHGVFEQHIGQVCDMVHGAGGQVYLDGANLNALVGLSKPAEFGADVCHINLHKTFCIPHGGGGPGMGPIAVKSHLKPFLPGHVITPPHGNSSGAVSAAGWGSASILPISWAYMAMMGEAGMRGASIVAILNANYIANRLQDAFPVLYRGKSGLVAHECILDLRAFKKSAGVEVADIAKRLMDYGFHAPTVSWPVPGTMMIEPTESESKQELDRYCDALLAIREEIALIESGEWSQQSNPIKNAPHTLLTVTASEWSYPYTRERAAYPLEWVEQRKFWPAVGRIDESYGDKNFHCTCGPLEDYITAD